MVITVATLEERVNNHIKFFWIAFSCGFAWLTALSWLIYNINATGNRIEKAQVSLEHSLTEQKIVSYSV
jgi:hypothetical protein